MSSQPQRTPDTPNLLDKLRSRESAPSQGKDIIPIPALIAVFVVVWGLVIYVMAPGWTYEMRAYLARRYQNAHQYEKAIPYQRKLTEQFPNNATYHSELGMDLGHAGQYDEAIERYKKAQELVNADVAAAQAEGRAVPPTDFSVPIGLLYLKKGDIASAEKYLSAGLAKNPVDRQANFAMGEIKMKQGDYEKASAYFKVVARDPWYEKQVQDYYEQIEKQLFSGL